MAKTRSLAGIVCAGARVHPCRLVGTAMMMAVEAAPEAAADNVENYSADFES